MANIGEKARQMRRRVVRRLDLPEDAIGRVFTVELRGDGDIVVTACSSVCEYGKERIVLALVHEYLELVGNGFEICSFSGGRVAIRGSFCELRILAQYGETV